MLAQWLWHDNFPLTEEGRLLVEQKRSAPRQGVDSKSILFAIFLWRVDTKLSQSSRAFIKTLFEVRVTRLQSERRH